MATLSVDGASAVQPTRAAVETQSTAPADTAAQASLRKELAAAVQKAAEAAEQQASDQEVQQAAKDLSEYLSVTSRSLNIRVDQELQRPVVTVLDAETDEVVRQIPSEEALAIARFIRSQQAKVDEQVALAGVILNEQG